jgi:hypothetical protein
MFGPSSCTNGYLDKFGREYFHAWKFMMAFLWRRYVSWGLVSCNEPILRILAIMVHRNLEKGKIGTNDTINRIKSNWKKGHFYYCLIFYSWFTSTNQ